MGIWAWAWANTAFKAVWNAFNALLVATGTKPVYIVMFLVCVVFRLLAVPFLGAALQAGSDTFRGWRDKDPVKPNTPLLPGRGGYR